MTLPTWYDAGTVSVAGSSTTVTGINTLWGGDAIMTGDLFCDPAQPLVPPQRIKQVVSDTELELLAPWPGSAMTDASYEIRYVGIIERSTSQTRRVLEQLGEVSAYYDVQVDTLADRDAFDARPAGFRVLVSDVGDGRAAIYSKASSVEADWTDPAMFSGPIGLTPEVTVGAVTTGDPGTEADVTATPVEGGVELDFTIPAGEGFSAEGDYDGGTAYAKGDVVQQMGSSWIALQATTGNAPPSLPTTSNAYWQLLARAGNDGAGTVTTISGGDGISVDTSDPTDPVVSLDIMGESVKTANYTLVAADYGGTFIADDTDPIEFAFEAAATLGAKWWVIVKNIGTGDLTLNPDGSETINGLDDLVVKTGESLLVTSNGTGFRTFFLGGGGGGGGTGTAIAMAIVFGG